MHVKFQLLCTKEAYMAPWCIGYSDSNPEMLMRGKTKKCQVIVDTKHKDYTGVNWERGRIVEDLGEMKRHGRGPGAEEVTAQAWGSSRGSELLNQVTQDITLEVWFSPVEYIRHPLSVPLKYSVVESWSSLSLKESLCTNCSCPTAYRSSNIHTRIL